MLNVHCRLSTRTGKSAEGYAAMSMGNVWSFPAPDIPYDTTLGAMKSLAAKIAKHHARLHGVCAPAGYQPRARTGVSEGGRRDIARDEAGAADSQALHAGDGEPRGCSDTRRLRTAARPQRLSRIRQGVRPLRPGALPRPAGIPRRVPGCIRLTQGRPAHPHVPLGGSVGRPDRGGGEEADRRRTSGIARGMDSVQRHHRDQDQAERQRPGLGRGPGGGNRPGGDGGAGEARRPRVDLLPRFQRALSRTCSTCWISSGR